ncbi:MAG: hypothetical protein AAF612_08075 [Planctomycetota bacterium]
MPPRPLPTPFRTFAWLAPVCTAGAWLAACAPLPAGPDADDPALATDDGTAQSPAEQPVWVIAPRDPEETERYALGSPDNPIRTHEPAGQQAYLARLRNLQGNPPAYRRIGPYGVGPYGYILDAYELTNPDTGETATLYLDMYHPGYREDRPIPGYQLLPAEPTDPRPNRAGQANRP